MRVAVRVEETELQGDHGPIDGIVVTCSRCDYSVEVFGTSERSIKRGCVMLKEQCQLEEENYYHSGED